jgi:hypothetical protein
MSGSTRHFHSAIVGGGPAGTGPLVYGAWSGRLGELLDRGLALIEGGGELGAGRLDRYAINSNSTGATFLECLEHDVASPYLAGSAASPLREEIGRSRDDVVPLHLAGGLLRRIGRDLLEAAARVPASQVYLQTRAEEVRVLAPGKFEIALRTAEGAAERITASSVLLATGGTPQVCRASGAQIAAACAAHGGGRRPLFMNSDELLQESGRRGAEAWLDGFDAPQVLIVGSAHSAFSSAWLVLERLHGGFELGPGAVTLLHRSPVKVCYDTVAQAHADGYDAFAPQDIGSKGQVFPMAGLRGDAKALYRRVAGLGDAAPEPRLRVAPLPRDAAGYAALGIDWENLALVVFATGYVQPEVPLRNARGNPIALQGQYTERYVDQQCRVLDVFGNAIPGLYASGFTSGFSPTDMLGGEASYAGKENSVWLCQHRLGETLFDTLLRGGARA